MYTLVSLSENRSVGRRDVGKVGRNPRTTAELCQFLNSLIFVLFFFSLRIDIKTVSPEIVYIH